MHGLQVRKCHIAQQEINVSLAIVLGRLPFDKAKYRRRFRRSVAATENIDPDNLRREPELMLSAHPDYRFLTPHERTELFMECYIRRYGMTYRSNVDHKDSHKMTGILRPTTKMFSKGAKLAAISYREYSSLWTARQKADELGIAYDKYTGYCMESHMKVNWKFIPRPNQLMTGAGAEIVLKYILKKCSEESLPTSFLPQYRNDFYGNLPAQNAHRVAVMSDIKSVGRISFRSALANQLVPEDDLIAVYDPEVLRTVREELRLEPISSFRPYDNPDRTDMFPGCFRMPFAYSESNTVCAKCPFQKLCSSYSSKYLKDNNDSNDYVNRRREQARIRQQRCRASRLSKSSSSAAVST
jgi:hypothetical protein